MHIFCAVYIDTSYQPEVLLTTVLYEHSLLRFRQQAIKSRCLLLSVFSTLLQNHKQTQRFKYFPFFNSFKTEQQALLNVLHSLSIKNCLLPILHILGLRTVLTINAGYLSQIAASVV